jgi:hypothetical protein
MRVLPVLTALPLVLAFGVGEGMWTNRWGWSEEAERAAARLADLPRAVGAWEGHDEKLDPREVAQAKMTGYLLRRFVHRRTGAALTVLLVCGRPGPVAVHTPDVCFPGAGYGLTRKAERHSVSADGLAQPAEFWVAGFEKEGAVSEPLRVFWAWNAAGDWVAPDNPRFQFARSSALYKLYVIRPLTRADEPPEKDPSTDFLRAFLPEAQRCLFPESSQ